MRIQYMMMLTRLGILEVVLSPFCGIFVPTKSSRSQDVEKQGASSSSDNKQLCLYSKLSSTVSAYSAPPQSSV